MKNLILDRRRREFKKVSVLKPIKSSINTFWGTVEERKKKLILVSGLEPLPSGGVGFFGRKINVFNSNWINYFYFGFKNLLKIGKRREKQH